MKKIVVITNSCGKRGCDTDRIILPNDGKFNNVHSNVFRKADDTSWLLCLDKLVMDSKEQEAQKHIIAEIRSGRRTL